MTPSLTVRMATGPDHDQIARLRYQVYASELDQYPVNEQQRLIDPAGSGNVYLVVATEHALAGFVSLTPPWAGRYFVERYFTPAILTDLLATAPFEVRALTVDPAFRNTSTAATLLYAAMRWVDGQHGRSAIAMGRAEITELYAKCGFRTTGVQITAGAVSYALMTGEGAEIEAAFARTYHRILPILERRVRWELDVPFRGGSASGGSAGTASGGSAGTGSNNPDKRAEQHKTDQPCLHGGRSFDAIGTGFDRLASKDAVVTADVLDAWFPPAPGVVAALSDDLPWLCRTSPPTQADGLIAQIAQTRGVPAESLVIGAGSSDLIYRAAAQLLTASSRVLVTRPIYGEYPHLIEQVVGARMEVLRLRPEHGWRLDLDELRTALRRRYDLVILVNPGNPTGGHIDRAALWEVLGEAPAQTTVWLDEAYVDYVGSGQSLEQFAPVAANLIVCKTMSKVYSLSGLRVGYLVTSARRASQLRRWTPPWGVGLPGQLAAVRALQDPVYYQRRWAETAALRAELAAGLRVELAAAAGAEHAEVTESVANFVLVRLVEPGSVEPGSVEPGSVEPGSVESGPVESGPTGSTWTGSGWTGGRPAGSGWTDGPAGPGNGLAAAVARHCEAAGVFVRDLSPLSADFGGVTIRIAVKSAALNERICSAVGTALRAATCFPGFS